MMAIVFAEKEKVEIWDDLEPPKIEWPEEILVRTIFTGISTGTERWVITGGPYSPGFPTIYGYQNVGKIEEVGSNVSDLAVGDYVLIDVSKPPANYAAKGLKYGWGRAHQEMVVPSSEQHGITLKLPSYMDLEECALLPVASIGLHTCKRGRIASGERVLVLGQGIIGQFCAQSARAIGGEVFGCDLDKWRLEMAKQYSCDVVLGPEKEAISEGIKDFGPFDVAIETTAVKGTMDFCLDAIRLFGRIVAVAGRFTMTYDNLKAQMHEAEIVHTSHFVKEDTLEVMRLCRRGKMQIKPLITHRLKLNDIIGFYNWILKSQDKLLGAIIDWHGA